MIESWWKNSGWELILDLHDCKSLPCTQDFITSYLVQLCKIIEMEREDLHFWDYEGSSEEYEKAPPHLKGISAVQFIKTSNITVHTLDTLKKVHLNIYSCKSFNSTTAATFSAFYFKGTIVSKTLLERE